MKKLLIVVAAIAGAALAGCTDSTTDGSSSGSSGSSTTTTTTGNTTSTTTGTSGSTGTTSTSGSTTTSGTTSGTTGTSAGFACGNGTLFAGDPNYPNPADVPTDGTSITADPPFHYRNLIFTQGQILTHMDQTIWRVDANNTLHIVAGSESAGQALIHGPCAQARFGNIFGIALGSDGTLYVSDQTANAIVKITDPLGPNCAMDFVAGANADLAEGSFDPSNPPNLGNTDGPGASAQFQLPERLAIDANDNLYVWDNGNQSIRKIAHDQSNTVSTVGTLPQLAVVSEAFLGGKLYLFGEDGSDAFLETMDLTNGQTTDVIRGRADAFTPDGSSSDSLRLGGLVSDGTALFISLNNQIIRVLANGQHTVVAGVYNVGLDYSSGYDPLAPHPADQTELLSLGQTTTAGLDSFLALDAAHGIYYSATSTSNYVEKFVCQ